ncbi:hypothetical protein BKA70DRAFT_1223022 [Coprinopsis sp. MPI-PUGE-AT-0042]|nr:hypothetical protein BKA70DRAFT_1223022 [Coprinopsis sp. MPI-PUGE-AT-0042]
MPLLAFLNSLWKSLLGAFYASSLQSLGRLVLMREVRNCDVVGDRKTPAQVGSDIEVSQLGLDANRPQKSELFFRLGGLSPLLIPGISMRKEWECKLGDIQILSAPIPRTADAQVLTLDCQSK